MATSTIKKTDHIWETNYYTVVADGSGVARCRVYVKIDVGLLIASYHSTVDNFGGVYIDAFGYFPSGAPMFTSHNASGNEQVSFSGNANELYFVINKPSRPGDRYHVRITKLCYNCYP